MNWARTLLITVFLSATLHHLHAWKQATVLSPDGTCSVSFVPLRPGSFEIRDSKGGTGYSSVGDSALKDEIVSTPEPYVLWSKDSNMVAVTFGYPFLKHTHIFVRDGSKFVRVPLPALGDKYDNIWILPDRWAEKSVLHLKISGPHAGKADGYSYRGTATVQIKGGTPFTCSKLTETIKEEHDSKE